MKNTLFIVILVAVLLACESKTFESTKKMPCCDGTLPVCKHETEPIVHPKPVIHTFPPGHPIHTTPIVHPPHLEVPCCTGKNGPVCEETQHPHEEAPCCTGKNGPVCSDTTVTKRFKCSWKAMGPKKKMQSMLFL